MKLNVKIFLLLALGILILSVFFAYTSVMFLARHQKSNFYLFRTELLEAGAEQMRYASDLFFNELDQELHRAPDVPIRTLVEQLYPMEGFITIIGPDGLSMDRHTTLLSREDAVSYIHSAQLNHTYRFTRNNFADFHSKTDMAVVPMIIYYKVYVQQGQWHLVGYGKVFRTLTDRLRFVARRNRQSLAMFITVSAGIVLGGITALLVFQLAVARRLIFLPLRRLQQVFQDIASGKLSRRIRVDRSDEIGALETSFNEMAEQLQTEIVTRQEAEDKLKQLKDHLEEEITRKTRDLHDAMTAAEAANEAKGRFLANMSHELRTPLNAIMGFNSLLCKTPLDCEQRQFIQTINHSSQVLLDLIHNILDHTKIEAGKIAFECIAFNLEDMIENIVEIMGPNAQSKEIDLLYFYPPELPKKFMGDPTRIRQILMNLVSNAIKFTHQGNVFIHISRQPAANSDSRIANLRFKVKDSGIGISAEKQTGIFQSFVQGDDSTTRKYGGTGLGLAITKGLVCAMNGTISLHSRPGKGSTFIVHLPLEFVGGQPAAPEMPSLFKNRSITIIDPSRAVLRVMGDVLCSYGMTVKPATRSSLFSYERAKHFLLDTPGNPVDIVLIAPRLPDGSGVKLLAECRARSDYGRTTFIALCSSVDVQQDEMQYRVHFDGYLTKPVIGRNLRYILMRNVSPVSWATTVNDSATDPLPGLGGLRILVAEDDLTSQTLMNIMLGKLGCEVTVAATGKQAVEAMRIHAFDLVLMDIMMPEMGGMEASAYIRKHLDMTTPIIALTAAALDANVLMDAGMNDCLFKPVQDNQIEAMLRKWIHLREVRIPEVP